MDNVHLGVQMACVEHNVRPDKFPSLMGVAKVAAENQAVIGRTIAKAAALAMSQVGRGDTAPAIHLALISKQANWIPQYKDAIDCVLESLEVLRSVEKRAFNVGDLAGAGQSALKGVGYGALGAGLGAGTLWWLLNRHATQDDADTQAMQAQVDYYNQLSTEIEDRLRRKYGYKHPQSEPQNEIGPTGPGA